MRAIFHVCDAPHCDAETKPPERLCPAHTSRLEYLLAAELEERRAYRAKAKAKRRAEQQFLGSLGARHADCDCMSCRVG